MMGCGPVHDCGYNRRPTTGAINVAETVAEHRKTIAQLTGSNTKLVESNTKLFVLVNGLQTQLDQLRTDVG